MLSCRRRCGARMLSLPSYAILKDAVEEIQIEALIAARRKVVERIASGNRDLWRALTEGLASTAPYTFNATEAGRRDLQGVALWYWLKAGDQAAFDFAADLYRQAGNQTDRSNALRAVLAGDDQALQEEMLEKLLRALAGRQPDGRAVVVDAGLGAGRDHGRYRKADAA